MYTFLEFFAGGGMARAGLGPRWHCLFANDFDHKKAQVYRTNWGDGELRVGNVGELTTADLPSGADLAWASFPCQDLSLAGGGAGLEGERSGTFWPFWRLVTNLAEGRAPEIIVLENVCGALTSHGGSDFSAICGAFEKAAYRVGAVVMDAAMFVPQSRPRLFVIGVRRDRPVPPDLIADRPAAPWHTRALQHAFNSLPGDIQASWIWWRIPVPPKRATSFGDIVDSSDDAPWFTSEETARLLSMMTEVNRRKIDEAMRLERRMVGGVYRRTRPDAFGARIQRAEVRFDGVSGCLRTPAGGSSRQVILEVCGSRIRARLITARETARLMGLPETFVLPRNYNEAYHLTGDGVVVPVVRHLARHILEPLVQTRGKAVAAAA